MYEQTSNNQNFCTIVDLPQFYLNEICKTDDATGQHTVIIDEQMGYKPISRTVSMQLFS